METIPVIRRTSSGRLLSPTREQILRIVEAAERPQSVPELAVITQLHENTVRGHVTALWNDGYLLRTSSAEHDEPGRPAWLWGASKRSVSSPYAALANALAEQLARSSDDASTQARNAGRTWGIALASQQRTELEAEELIENIMRDEGFAPESQPGSADGSNREILLRQCPLIDAATRHPEIVCAVHLGMVQGALETRGMSSAGTTLTPFISAGTCSLQLHISTISPLAPTIH